ncbi:xanthine dehydrogenase accessory protein XdhC [Jannaschia sp. M317]|uniref:xanthine dehydrogenase accessory protein XdhC n=1 Tax=Jannaschia sp. M317 TaxID=2867011 RepID=UPI0021A4C197|nr:xanthine dehydrogenase accessory protein XdhC [Jannaschia sp. M317]UWQ17685.1 xanthine dehydrogenase accessory protein XdhC [Jannaschia sp. M317]
MTLDAQALARALAGGPVARVVVAEARGSAPRGAGTEMLARDGIVAGTIGGGALEWRALDLARAVLACGQTRVVRMPLGPALGQCCGGAVTLVVERIAALPATPWARRVEGTAPEPAGPYGFRDGWLREGAQARRPIWIWGAGHVGQALAAVLAPLPDLAVTVIDEPARMPDLPPGITPLAAADMPRAMALAPAEAEHFILTYSHEIDLALCHAALTHGFSACGLIGSPTKWARFRTRLASLGHGPKEIGRIRCPIGAPELGSHPQAIAVGVAAGLLSAQLPAEAAQEGTAA